MTRARLDGARVSIYYALVKFAANRPCPFSIDNERGRLVDSPLRTCPLSVVVYQLLVNDANLELHVSRGS